MIIVFSGTDGAGKSTQIERLLSFYKSRNEKAIYLWSRGGYTFGISFLKKVLRVLLGKGLPQAGQGPGRDKLLNKGVISKLWLSIAIIDLIFLYGVYCRCLSVFGYKVVCDRYVDDTLLDFRHNFSGTFNEHGFLWMTLIAVAPEPKYSFLLFVPIDVSQYRSNLKNEPFPDSEETLRFRLDSYLDDTLFPCAKYKRISCVDEIDAIANKILMALE